MAYFARDKEALREALGCFSAKKPVLERAGLNQQAETASHRIDELARQLGPEATDLTDGQQIPSGVRNYQRH